MSMFIYKSKLLLHVLFLWVIALLSYYVLLFKNAHDMCFFTDRNVTTEMKRKFWILNWKMNESRERIRRERDREKNTYSSPRLALRRVLLLAEGRQFREAAAILSRLGPGVLQSVAAELPIDLLVEALPHSTYLLETLLTR